MFWHRICYSQTCSTDDKSLKWALSSKIVSHSDLNWAQDLESCKSVANYLIAYKVTSWISYQQMTVVLSLTKTE